MAKKDIGAKVICGKLVSTFDRSDSSVEQPTAVRCP